MIGNKSDAEAMDCACTVVEERRTQLRRFTVRKAGACASENAGMSNDNAGENPARRKPKVSWGR